MHDGSFLVSILGRSGEGLSPSSPTIPWGLAMCPIPHAVLGPCVPALWHLIRGSTEIRSGWPRTWIVIGGAEKGGIIVREAEELPHTQITQVCLIQVSPLVQPKCYRS